ncbi:MMPL family transporter [Frankia sp. Cppng1_Ct_nod]|uniref:MMPL family transporter n=1 Tax=Frankia sp. Cppng1_Ct_nod TaxID=2897162 RepID=UPI001040E9B5|nr:MMPL family transporter [Frankia sp. Cppng1_Ct_nod]
MLANLGYFLHRRRNLVGAISLGFVILAGAWGGNVQSKMSIARDSFDAPHAESVVAQKELQRVGGASPEPDFVALVRNPRGIASSDGNAQVKRVVDVIASQSAVARLAAPFGTPNSLRTPVSADGHVTYVAAFFRPIDDTTAQTDAKQIKKSLAAIQGVEAGGPLLVYSQLNDQVKHDATLSELVAFPVLFILSFIFFRGMVAAAMPLVIAAVSVVGTFAVLRTVVEFTSLSVFAVNLVTALGLGLAIDYSLFIVNRYREELAAGGPPDSVLARTLASAGRTVAFSSLTVTLAFLALLVFPQQSIRSMGVGGLAVAAISGIASLIVLPALLAKLGERVNSFAPAQLQRAARRSAQPDESGPWYRLASFVMRRAAAVAVATALLLIAIGLPALGAKFGRPDATVLPAGASARQVSEQINTAFGANASAPIVVAVHAPPDASAQVLSLAGSVRGLPGVVAVQPPQQVGPGLWQLNVTSRGDAVSSSAQTAVRSLRSISVPPLQLKVSGEPARYVDQQTSIGHKLPAALTLLVVTSLVALLFMTGSVVLPIKALVMNLLTLSAMFGVLVLVFQDGHFQGVLDFTSSGVLEPETMVLLFVVAFALTTDYGVFLLSRIKEARDTGMSNTEAVAHGLERTGRIVSAAALLMSVALGTLVISKIEYIKELGLGAAFAIAIDALVVRPLLVPALMKLLGRWNWWAPPRLRAIGQRVAVEAAGSNGRSDTSIG